MQYASPINLNFTSIFGSRVFSYHRNFVSKLMHVIRGSNYKAQQNNYLINGDVKTWSACSWMVNSPIVNPFGFVVIFIMIHFHYLNIFYPKKWNKSEFKKFLPHSINVFLKVWTAQKHCRVDWLKVSKLQLKST